MVSGDALLEGSDPDRLPRRLLLLDISPETNTRVLGQRYSTPVPSTTLEHNKLTLSRSQPDLTQIPEGKVTTYPVIS